MGLFLYQLNILSEQRVLLI